MKQSALILAALVLAAAMPLEAAAERIVPKGVSSWRNDGVSTTPAGKPATPEKTRKTKPQPKPR